MVWTDYDEIQFKELLERREQNKEEAGNRVLIRSLRALADSIEKGEKPLYQLEVEYLRHDIPGYPNGYGPVYGHRYIFEIRDHNEAIKT